MRIVEGRPVAELADCEVEIKAGQGHVSDCGCAGCMWVRFVQEDPFGAGAELAMAADLEADDAYSPTMLVRELLSRFPWMDWLLLRPPAQRRWLLEGMTFSEATFPIFSAVVPAWAWGALRAEGEVGDD